MVQGNSAEVMVRRLAVELYFLGQSKLCRCLWDRCDPWPSEAGPYEFAVD